MSVPSHDTTDPTDVVRNAILNAFYGKGYFDSDGGGTRRNEARAALDALVADLAGLRAVQEAILGECDRRAAVGGISSAFVRNTISAASGTSATLPSMVGAGEDEATRPQDAAENLSDENARLRGTVEQLTAALTRAAYVSEHLLARCESVEWTGVIGPEGQREDDYLDAKLAVEIKGWAALVAASGETKL